MTLRYAELFAGAGGLSLGLDRAGFECAWHAEIADFPRRVLKHRWPDVPLYGDVTELDGAELVRLHGPIDLLSGGSPCQDLSVAGKRKGMTEGSGTRSSLFYEQLRIWNETGAEFLLWENVDGARSSNEGKDFASVLSAIVGGAVAVPSDGWSSGGVAAGRTGIAAWRVLDAQFFGVPQRRRRIFVLCSRTGRVDPAEVLSLSESLRGDTSESGETREGLTASLGVGTTAACSVADSLTVGANQTTGFIGEVVAQPRLCDVEGGVKLFAIAHGEARERDIASRIPANSGPNRHGEGSHSATQFDAILTDCASTEGGLVAFDSFNQDESERVEHSLRTGGQGDCIPAVFAFGWQNSPEQGDSTPNRLTPALDKSKTPAVLAIDLSQVTSKTNRSQPSAIGPTLNAGGNVVAFENHGQDSRFNQLSKAFPAINQQAGTGGNNLPLILAWDDELNPSENIIGSLKARQKSGQSAQGIIAPTFSPGAHPGGFNGQDLNLVAAVSAATRHGVPRRLMPIECERLMSWPDNWTNVADSNGKPASDAARYKACGNGVASNCVQWIAERLFSGLSEPLT